MRPSDLLLTALTVACVACVPAPEPANDTTETGDTKASAGDTETGDTETDTGDPQPRVCDEGLELCCFGDAIDCEDEWETGDHSPDKQQWGCVDTTVSRYHCGGCNDRCPIDQIFIQNLEPVACHESVCDPTLGSACRPTGEGLTCAELCAIDDKTCVAQGCHSDTMFIYSEQNFECNSDVGILATLDLACDELPPAEYTAANEAMRCCCE